MESQIRYCWNSKGNSEKMKKVIIFLSVLTLLITSCKKEVKKEQTIPSSDQRVIVINEGNFGWGNADFGVYDPTSKEYQDHVFETINKRPLGDVLQSAIIHKDEMFLVINNSGTIEVVDKINFKHKRTLSNLGTPRYLAVIEGTDEAYLSDTYSNKVSRINLKTGKILSQTPAFGWLDRIVSINYKTYLVPSLISHVVYFISSENNSVIDSIKFEGDLGKIQVFNDKVYLLERLTGKSVIWEINENKELNPFLEQEDANIELFDMTSDGCFVLSEGKLSIYEDSHFSSLTSLPATGKYYTMNYDNRSKLLYIADVRDYVRKGLVFVINKQGSINAQVEVGTIPNGFLFE